MKKKSNRDPLNIRNYAIYSAILWTFLIAAILQIGLSLIKDEALNNAYVYTKVGFEKDVLYRRWVAEHGGVYVKVDSTTPPNPYLSHIPDRDIQIDSSLQFTLMNPAYMTRQVNELEKEISEVHGHITSLNLLRPDNAPDEWEIKALQAFEKGIEEFSGVSEIDGKEYFRFMKPFLTEESCLKCHAHQGYKVNDIRGGVSLSYPMDKVYLLTSKDAKYHYYSLVLLWVLGLGIIIISYKNIRKSANKQLYAEDALRELNEELEDKVEIKSRELQKSQHDWENIFNTLETPAQLIDKNYIIKYVNDETLKIFKLKKEDIIGKKCHELFGLSKPPDNCPLSKAALGKRSSSEELSFELLNKNFIVSCSPIFDSYGEIEYFMHIMTDVSEREEAEQQFKTLIEQAGDAFYLSDFKGNIIGVNNEAIKELGYSRNEFLKMKIWNLDKVYPDLKTVLNFWNEMKPNVPFTFETIHKRKDGSFFDVELRSTVTVLKGEKVIMGFARNISERKKSDEALSHSRNLMRYTIEHNRSAVAVHDKDMKYIYVSKRYLDDYKVKEKDIIGKHHYDVFPDLPQKWRDVHQKALNGEISSAEDDPYYKDDGSVVWTRWECRPWYEADNSIGGIIIYTEVITERKLIEERIKESEANLKSLIENRDDSIWSVDKNLNFLTFNSFFAKAYQASYDIELKKGMNAVTILSAKLKKLWKPKYKKVLAGESIVFEFSEQFDDKNQFFEVSMNPISNEDEITGISSIANNITERKNIEIELENYRKNLEEIVNKRTKDLEDKNKSLEEMNKIFVGRENRMAELKEEIERLKGTSTGSV